MPLPGDIGLVHGGGLGRTLILLGDRIKARREGIKPSPFAHVVVYVGDGQVVEAQPAGARQTGMPEGAEWRTWHIPLTDEQRGRLSAYALSLIGTPYSWLAIAALTLADLGCNVQRDDGGLTRIGTTIRDSGELVCSQLVDLVYDDCHLHLFDDGRLPGEVTPGDLDRCPLLVETT